MNPDLCNLHSLPINRVCGNDTCCMIICEACFVRHQAQSKHSAPIIMNPSTIAFFINVTHYLIDKFQELINIVKTSGINTVFQIVGGVPNFLDTKNMITQIEKIAIDIIHKNRNLTLNNHSYISQNKDNYRNLLHPQFLRDLYRLNKEQWKKSAQRLCQQLKNALIAHFPTRYIFRRINIYINPTLVAQIEFQITQLLSQNPQKTTQQWKQPSKLSDLEISKVESIIQQKITMAQQEKIQPPLSKHVESFYEVLEKSQVSLQQNPFQIADVLKQHPAQQISPNFLSYEDLEKQIEELLMENERLCQANIELSQQNASLKRQNADLRMIRHL